jgi:hypothetical protein
VDFFIDSQTSLNIIDFGVERNMKANRLDNENTLQTEKKKGTHMILIQGAE